MPSYGLIVMGPMGANPLDQVELLETVDGTRGQAEARMRQLIGGYHPRHPVLPRRTRVFRTGDDWLMVLDGAMGKPYAYQFRMCELEWDSALFDHAGAPPQQPKDAIPFQGLNAPQDRPPT